MHPRTIATLEKLEKADWFANVGVQDAEGYAIVMSSWDEAMAYCTSADSRNL